MTLVDEQPQMTFEDIGTASGFSIRRRDELLRTVRRAYRLTRADRAQLVRIAARTAGPGATCAEVDAALSAKLTGMFRLYTDDEILATAVAVSPCRTFAVLPLTERAFYSFLNPRFSPKVKGVFLWEQFKKECTGDIFISVFREVRYIDRPWWSDACRSLVRRGDNQLCRGASFWRSLGLTDRRVPPLVKMFPECPCARVLLDDAMADAVDRQNEAYTCGRSS